MSVVLQEWHGYAAPVHESEQEKSAEAALTENLAADNKSSLLGLLKTAPCYAIPFDESCDIADDEQMFIFIRFFGIDSKVLFRDELLAIVKLKGNTRGEDLFKDSDDFMTKSSFSYDKIVSISNDGAPAMIGKEKRLVKRIRDKNAGIISYQCTIQQTSPSDKFRATLKNVMDGLVKLVNFMRRSDHIPRKLNHGRSKEVLGVPS
ncbi:hypothetical protein ILUMI_01698 [Ignelater luminosus]|uniref:Uncharacterized protein n=1 Tax=Ignelater luminosus TaxID=2038154 RepID=A0A8K0DJI4_IGNLU|nr:hypothetical protein ILUMI_01698 [Ignelater luminosus]